MTVSGLLVTVAWQWKPVVDYNNDHVLRDMQAAPYHTVNCCGCT